MALREQIRAREPVVGSWLTLADPAVGEMTAELGFDFVVIDIEHTPSSLETVGRMARAVDAASGDTGTIVRLPWNDPVVIKRVLDLGVSGVMAPMVGDAGEARSLVDATRYPPDGIRGVAGGRAARYGLDLPEYFHRANEEVLAIAQIETEAGFENVEEIARVEGLDALFVGPSDLSANLGMYGEWDTEEFRDAVDRVLTAGAEAGTAVSTLATRSADIERWIDAGFDFMMAGTDGGHVLSGSIEAKRTFESAVEARES